MTRDYFSKILEEDPVLKSHQELYELVCIYTPFFKAKTAVLPVIHGELESLDEKVSILLYGKARVPFPESEIYAHSVHGHYLMLREKRDKQEISMELFNQEASKIMQYVKCASALKDTVLYLKKEMEVFLGEEYNIRAGNIPSLIAGNGDSTASAAMVIEVIARLKQAYEKIMSDPDTVLKKFREERSLAATKIVDEVLEERKERMNKTN